MLHDPSHYETPVEAEPIRLLSAERRVLCQLASEIAEIAALPVHQEKARLWRKLNDLDFMSCLQPSPYWPENYTR